MPTDADIEEFIRDSFASIWDLEVLCELLARPAAAPTAAELVERMRASEQVVAQGAAALVTAGIAVLDGEQRLHFQPVNDAVAACARLACDFYARFPGRTRRLIVGRRAPGLNAFADAFRLRKD